MARILQSALVSIVQSWIPEKDETQIQYAANLVLQELNLLTLDFLNKRVTVTTSAPVTTPTITIAQGATAATVASGTFPTTYDGQFIKLSGSNVWYEISATVADTSFTISSAFESTSLTGGTCEIAFPRVELPADFIYVGGIARPNSSPLEYVTDQVTPFQQIQVQTAEPTVYYHTEPENTSDYLEIMLLDFPDAIYTYVVVGKLRLALFSGSSTKSGLPELYNPVLVAGTLAYVLDQERGTEASAYWRGLYFGMKKDMRKHKGPVNVGEVGRVGDMLNLPAGVEPLLATDNA